MKTVVARMSTKNALRIMLSGFILLALVISSMGIYFSTKKDKPKLAVSNPIEFATDKWDGVSSSATEWNKGQNYGKRGEDVYTITSAESFIYFVQLVNDGNTFKGKTVYLNKNIDLNNNSIDSLKYFEGTFDGAYYGIYNANIVGDGLFNTTANATIQNLGMYNCNIQGNNLAGGLIGEAINTNVANCFVRLGEISAKNVAAGLIGTIASNNNTISNSFAHTTIKGNQIAGIVGNVSGNLNVTNCYHTENNTTLNLENITLTQSGNVRNINFSTWDYSAEYSLTKTWCNYSYAEGSTELNFQYPILTRFNKVFLTGSCYENVVIKDGEIKDVETISDAFSIVENEKAEVNIIVEKVFMEETATATGTSYITLTSSTNTILERGKTNTEAMVKGVDYSSLVIGTKNADKDTPTMVFDGNREYAERNNLTTDAAIVSSGYDFMSHSNVMVKDNINNKTGYGGGISLIFPYKASYASTDEISAVGIDGTIVMNCQSTKDGGGIYIGGTFASFAPGFGLNISNCQAGGNGGGISMDLSYDPTVQSIVSHLNVKVTNKKVETLAFIVDTSGRVDYTAKSDIWFYNGRYAYQVVEPDGNDDVPDGGLVNCSGEHGGGLNVIANGYQIVLGDSDNGEKLYISGCTATGVGGGARINGADLWLCYLSMTGNTAGSEGGGLHADQCSLITIENNNYSVQASNNNTAGTNGGGFYFSRSTVVSQKGNDGVYGSIASNGNKAKNGAGIYFNNSIYQIYTQHVYNNEASENGGGVYIRFTEDYLGSKYGNTSGALSTVIQKCRFMYNTLIGGGPGRDFNIAKNGGGIYLDVKYIYSSSHWSFEDLIVHGNKASENGGGIYCNNSEVSITRSSFQYNYSTKDGGAIYVTGSDSYFYSNSCTFISNSSDARGGAICVASGYYSLNSIGGTSLIQYNTAKDGPALFIASGAGGGVGGAQTTIQKNKETDVDSYRPEITVYGQLSLDEYVYIINQKIDGSGYTNTDVYLATGAYINYSNLSQSINDSVNVIMQPPVQHGATIAYARSESDAAIVKEAIIIDNMPSNMAKRVEEIRAENGSTTYRVYLHELYEVKFTHSTNDLDTNPKCSVYATTGYKEGVNGSFIYYIFKDDIINVSNNIHGCSFSFTDITEDSKTVTYSALTETINQVNYHYTYLSNKDNNNNTWSDNKLTVNSDKEIITIFNLKQYKLSYSCRPDNVGTITTENKPDKIPDKIYGNETFNLLNEDDKLTVNTTALTVNPNPGYEFDHWEIVKGDKSIIIGDQSSEDGTYTPQQIHGDDYAPTPEINVIAVFKTIEYDLEFYYDGDVDGDYENVDNQSNPDGYEFVEYTIEESSRIFVIDPTVTPDGRIFAYWVFDARNLGTRGYSGLNVLFDGDDLKVTADGLSLSFDAEATGVDGVYKLIGFSSTTGNYGDLVQDPSDPLIYAYYGYNYTVTPNVSNSIWTEDSVDGVVVKGTNEFEIDRDSNKKFAGGEGKAFEIGGDVFSFGQEISNWTVSVGDTEWSYDGSTWVEGDSTIEPGTPFNSLAQKLDNSYLITNAGNDKYLNFNISEDIEISAIFESVKGVIINTEINSHTTQNVINFNNSYSLRSYGLIGKSIAYYLDTTKNVPVAVNGYKWNYVKLEYSYNTDTQEYSATLKPVFVNNVYRVSLKGVDPYVSGGNEYVLCDNSYQFNSKYNAIDDLAELTYYEFENSLKDETQNRNSYTYADLYAAKIQTIVGEDGSIFNESLFENEDLKNNYLKKVFIQNASVSGKTATLNAGASFNAYIYLINNQIVGHKGNLPAFDKQSYTPYYWTNEYTNISDNVKYKYKTGVFTGSNISNEKTVWNLSDGYEISGSIYKAGLTMNGGYYRKNYRFNVRTLYNSVIGPYGYAILTVNDEIGSEDAKYLVLSNKDRNMRAYNITNWSELTDFKNTIDELPDDGDIIKVYDGSSIKVKVYDQSIDSTVYDEMVGYKYINLEWKVNGEIITSTDFEHTLSRETITNAAMGNGEYLSLDINFDKIEYALNVSMNDNSAGTYLISTKTSKTQPLTGTTTLKNIVVGEKITIEYSSSAGYELENNAITFKSSANNYTSITLLNYDAQDDTKISQKVEIEITGKWLRDSYYNGEIPPLTGYAYPTNGPTDTSDGSYEDQYLGEIIINTKKIDFDWQVQIVDLNYATEITTIQITDTNKWQIGNNIWSDSENLEKVFVYNETIGSWIVEYDGSYYAPISSYGKIGENITNAGVLTTNYTFLTDTITINGNVSSTDILRMVGAQVGVIVPYNSRTLTMIVDVREMYAVNIRILSIEHDLDQNKQFTITNGNGNNKTVNEETLTNTIYTYDGLNNSITYSYDSKFYSDVKFYLNSSLTRRLTETEFKVNAEDVSKITDVYAVFTPKALEVEYVYKLNDAISTKEDLSTSGLLNLSITQSREENLYVDDYIEFNLTNLHSDYVLSVLVNNVEQGLVQNVAKKYTVTTQNFQNVNGKILVEILVNSRPEETIEFRYFVNDGRGVEGDIPAIIKLKDAGVNKVANFNTPVGVIQGHTIKFKVEVYEGYTFYGYAHNTSPVQTVESLDLDVDGYITLSDSFDTDNEDGVYYIYVTKKDVKATLNTTDKLGVYKLKSDFGTTNSNTITGLYVNAIVKFETTENERESFNYIYYTKKDGSQVMITAQQAENGLTITSAMLQTLEFKDNNYLLNFNVNTTPKYMLTIEGITKDVSLQTSEDISKYILSKTSIDISIAPAEEQDLGKYTLQLTGEGLNLSGTSINTSITLTKDTTLTLTISPKEQEITILEYLKETIDGYVPVEEQDMVNNASISGGKAYYKQPCVVTLTCMYYDNTELSQLLEKLIITNESGDEVSVNISYTKEDGNISDANVIGESGEYTIRITGNAIEISYTAVEAITINCYYTGVKIIQQ